VESALASDAPGDRLEECSFGMVRLRAGGVLEIRSFVDRHVPSERYLYPWAPGVMLKDS
jgi:hypothetical protein